MFCGCPNAFGGEPNTRICPVGLGLPGTPPFSNRRGRPPGSTALALGATSRPHQVRSEELFLSRPAKGLSDLAVRLPLTQRRRALRIEDGSAQSQMTRFISRRTPANRPTRCRRPAAGESSSLIDFNRAGSVIEYVGKPDLRSAAEAVGFLETLARTFRVLGVSDVKMEEGSLGCDANVCESGCAASTKYGTKAEIKNMNSFRSVRRAIESESRADARPRKRRPRDPGDARLGVSPPA